MPTPTPGGIGWGVKHQLQRMWEEMCPSEGFRPVRVGSGTRFFAGFDFKWGGEGALSYLCREGLEGGDVFVGFLCFS